MLELSTFKGTLVEEIPNKFEIDMNDILFPQKKKKVNMNIQENDFIKWTIKMKCEKGNCIHQTKKSKEIEWIHPTEESTLFYFNDIIKMSSKKKKKKLKKKITFNHTEFGSNISYYGCFSKNELRETLPDGLGVFKCNINGKKDQFLTIKVVYKGNLKLGKLDGYGTLTYEMQGIEFKFEGYFKNNEMNENATISISSKKEILFGYRANFKKDKAYGNNVVVFSKYISPITLMILNFDLRTIRSEMVLQSDNFINFFDEILKMSMSRIYFNHGESVSISEVINIVQKISQIFISKKVAIELGLNWMKPSECFITCMKDKNDPKPFYMEQYQIFDRLEYMKTEYGIPQLIKVFTKFLS